MKLADQLAFMRGEIRRSKRWRNKEQYDELWKRMIDLYRGKHYWGTTVNDRLVVNLAFATKNVIAPSVALRNPRFVVNARDPQKAPNAIITEEVLNYLWRYHRYQDEIRLAVDDSIICGHGWIKCGYKFVKEPKSKTAEEIDQENQLDPGDTEGVDDRDDVPGNVESEMHVAQDRPFLERVSIFDMFVDPNARHPKEMRWIAQRTWRPVQDVQVDSRYSRQARLNVSATSYSRWDSTDGDGRTGDDKPDQGPLSYCEIIEFYDLKRKTVATFAMDGSDVVDQGNAAQDGFLIKPQPAPYTYDNCFLMLRSFEVPDHFYPMGDLEQIESLQLELNETRTQMINHRKRFARKWLYLKDAFDTDGVRALQSDVDNTMVPVENSVVSDISSAVGPMPSVVTPPEFYNHSSLIENDINQISGTTDYMRGGDQNIKRTATEAAMIQDAANARAQDRLNKIESFIADAGERVIKLMQQFMTGEQMVRITGVAGRAWVKFDRDYLAGDFDFEVEGGSTEPNNESFRRQAALQMVDAMAPFIGAGVVDPVGLARYVLQYGFGVRDTSQLLVQQQPQVDPETGQPIGPEGMMPGEEAQPASLAGGGPPISEGLPPELMAMMQQGPQPQLV